MVGYCSRAPFAVLLFAISVLVYVPAYVSAGTESQILATAIYQHFYRQTAYMSVIQLRI